MKVLSQCTCSVQFSSVQSLSHVRLFATPWIAACQASLSITISRSSLRFMSIDAIMDIDAMMSIHVSDAIQPSHPLSSPSPAAPKSFPASESFPMSQLLAWGGQSTGASALASFLPKKSQGWAPSEWTGWISLQSKGLSRVFSNTSVQKHHFSVLSLLHRPTLTSIHDYWKNHSLDEMDLCWQSNVSAFEYAI